MTLLAYYDNPDGTRVEAALEPIPDFHILINRCSDYNGEFGFDRYEEETHKTMFQYSYKLRADIKNDYRVCYISVWPPANETSKVGIDKACNTKAKLELEFKKNKKRANIYTDKIKAILPDGIMIENCKNEYSFSFKKINENKLNTHTINIECYKALMSDALIEFKDKNDKVVGAFSVKANDASNLKVINAKILHTVFVDADNKKIGNPSPLNVTAEQIETYFNTKSFNQALIYVKIDKKIEEEELFEKNIESIFLTKRGSALQSEVSKDFNVQDKNKEMNEILEGQGGNNLKLIRLSEENKNKYCSELSIVAKAIKKSKAVNSDIKKKKKELEKLEKEIEKRDKKIAKAKNEQDFVKISNEYHIVINRTTRTHTPVKGMENESLDKKKSILKNELEQLTKEMNFISTQAQNETDKNMHYIHISSQTFGCYKVGISDNTIGLAAGFAMGKEYDAFLFGAAINSGKLRLDLFAHEFGHLMGLGEFFNDIKRNNFEDIYAGVSKENFMDYNIDRMSFQMWQWEKMHESLKKIKKL